MGSLQLLPFKLLNNMALSFSSNFPVPSHVLVHSPSLTRAGTDTPPASSIQP